MMCWQTITVFGSIAKIERMFLKFRELIDSDDAIPPELRSALHATLDTHFIFARERLFLQSRRAQQRGADARLSHQGTTRSE